MSQTNEEKELTNEEKKLIKRFDNFVKGYKAKSPYKLIDIIKDFKKKYPKP